MQKISQEYHFLPRLPDGQRWFLFVRDGMRLCVCVHFRERLYAVCVCMCVRDGMTRVCLCVREMVSRVCGSLNERNACVGLGLTFCCVGMLGQT